MSWNKNECFTRDVPRCVACEGELTRDEYEEGYCCFGCAGGDQESANDTHADYYHAR